VRRLANLVGGWALVVVGIILIPLPGPGWLVVGIGLLVLGREVRLKYLPRLEFHRDPAIEQGQRVEDIIRSLHAEE